MFNGYLLLNLIVGWNVLEAERNDVHYQHWLKPLIYISIPWAVSIHTVTAFLYSGLPGRGFWLTAILAPRFLSFGLRRRPGPADSAVPVDPQGHAFRSRARSRFRAWPKSVAYAIMHQRVLFSLRDFRGLLQQIPGTHGSH